MKAWIGPLALALTVGGCKRTDAPAFGPPAYLSTEAHTLLRSRMHRHADDASDLLWAVLELDTDQVAVLSDRIATEPQLAKPSPDSPEDLLNRALPPQFFELQTELRNKAVELVAAAKSKDSRRVSEAYGRMVTTCVTCHEIYVARSNINPGN